MNGLSRLATTVWEGDNPPPPYAWQAPNIFWALFIPRPR